MKNIDKTKFYFNGQNLDRHCEEIILSFYYIININFIKYILLSLAFIRIKFLSKFFCRKYNIPNIYFLMSKLICMKTKSCRKERIIEIFMNRINQTLENISRFVKMSIIWFPHNTLEKHQYKRDIQLQKLLQ